MGHGLDGVRRGGLSLLLPLEDFPVGEDLIAGVGGHGAAEHMGMAEDHFLRHAVHHVCHGEAAPLLLHDGVEHHLHENVPQLLAHVRRAVLVQRVDDLVCLLQEIPADGLMGLLGVPGAAPGTAQKAHDRQEILIVIAALTLKIYHTLSPIARKFNGKPGDFPRKAYFKCRSLISF